MYPTRGSPLLGASSQRRPEVPVVSSVAIDVASGLALVFFVVATIATGVDQNPQPTTQTPEPRPSGSPSPQHPQPHRTQRRTFGALTAFSFGANHNDSRPLADLHPNPGSTVATGAATTTATTTDLAVEATHALLATPSLRSLDPVITTGKSTKIQHRLGVRCCPPRAGHYRSRKRDDRLHRPEAQRRRHQVPRTPWPRSSPASPPRSPTTSTTTSPPSAPGSTDR